jgi:hypothetical protein
VKSYDDMLGEELDKSLAESREEEAEYSMWLADREEGYE